LTTVATSVVLPLALTVAVGGVTLTPMPFPPPPLEPVVIWIDAEAKTAGEVTEVAVMVTIGDDGTVAGAVYTVLAPLSVAAGLMVPQPPASEQVTVQVTPALAGSFSTVAVRVAVAPVATEVPDWLRLTVSAPAGVVMVIGTEAVLLGSVTEIAVRVTVPPAGTFAGAE
jgi:hypothetical protein